MPLRLPTVLELPIFDFIYSPIFRLPGFSPIALILLVEAGRFERPTPCAQGWWPLQRQILSPLRLSQFTPFRVRMSRAREGANEHLRK
jgi:hypothetical protein